MHDEMATCRQLRRAGGGPQPSIIHAILSLRRFAMTSAEPSRPSSFLVGLVILSACLISFYIPLRPALQQLDEHIDTLKAPPLPCLVLVASFLNSASHTAVILNLLEDTMIISILIGVSFDVLSELLYLSFWVQLGQISSIHLPKSFVLVYAPYATYHLTVHVRALLMTRSFRRLESVVRSAYHNIIGYPGDSYYVDHIFAFSDTAFHLFHLGVVSVVVGLGKSVQIIGAAVMAAMLLACVGVGFIGGQRPIAGSQSTENGDVSSLQLKQQDKPCNTLGRRGDRPICSCKTCVQFAGPASGTTLRAAAFCIRRQGLSLSVCDLWQKSFRETLSLIDDCNALATTDAKAQ